MLAGDNGILQKATTAKESTDSSQIQERINLAYHSSLVDGQGKVTEPSLESEIKKDVNICVEQIIKTISFLKTKVDSRKTSHDLIIYGKK